uniref:Uncharacterized protein n=1 Tax=Eutreptiella gymnastica TaxID=73025 RepID=A0A7S4L9Y3_9EUGL
MRVDPLRTRAFRTTARSTAVHGGLSLMHRQHIAPLVCSQHHHHHLLRRLLRLRLRLRWVPEALDLLFGEWSTHMDTRLQQWISKHNTAEMQKTMDQLVQSPMGSAKKRLGFSPRGM